MSEKSSSSSSSGIGIGGIIFVVLLVGKLAGYFPNLSWFIVLTSIIWAPLAGILIVLAFIGIGALIVLGGVAGVSAISDANTKAQRRKLLKK